jgi:hypothetical protein
VVGSFSVPVQDIDFQGWLCAVREPQIASHTQWHITVLTTFGRSFAHARTPLGPVATHPCLEKVLVEEAEAVGYLSGPIVCLQHDLENRHAFP